VLKHVLSRPHIVDARKHAQCGRLCVVQATVEIPSPGYAKEFSRPTTAHHMYGFSLGVNMQTPQGCRDGSLVFLLGRRPA
jgi:hypothetical protein